jgi:hypothetical protein
MTAEQDAEKMPPLPGPTFFTHDYDLSGVAHKVTGYTPDQMRAYGEQVWQAATLAAQARTAEVVERAVEALEESERWMRRAPAQYALLKSLDTVRASISELQQHLGKKQ